MATPFVAPDPTTFLPKLGDRTREPVRVGERTFTIVRPDRSDKLLDHPEVHEAFQRDEYMPYWAELWPAARMLAKSLLREPLPPGATALELGCGLGLAGIVALSRGIDVVFSDYDACALVFAADNARLNGFDRFRTLQLDWRDPPPELKVPLVLGSDLIYEARNVAPLLSCLERVLVPGGRCLITDQDRLSSATFQDSLRQLGWPFTMHPVKAGEPGGRRLKGTLYRIDRPA
jgi:predicted nicotinamide N-methyase